MAFQLPNCLEAIVCSLACFRMQFVVVPLDYQYHPLQIGYALGHSGASILIADHGHIAGLDEAGVLGAVSRIVVVRGGAADGKRRSFESLLGAERLLSADSPHDDAPAVMIYTFGTTSRPKGVVLSHGALSTGVRKYLSRVILTPDDVTLIATSISRQLALRCQLLPTLWAGGRVSLVGRFTVDSYVDALRRPPAQTFLTLTPLEVEAALSEHPAVRESCIIGVPDAACGEAPHAYVVLQAGATAGPQDLRAFVGSRLAEFMVPAEVHLVSEMPYKGPGKIERSPAVRELPGGGRRLSLPQGNPACRGWRATTRCRSGAAFGYNCICGRDLWPRRREWTQRSGRLPS